MEVKVVHFDELDPLSLYEILQLRSHVFVVEQNCPYLDLDGEDKQAYHIIIQDEDKIIGTARILTPEQNKGKMLSMGRFVISANYRHMSLGQKLMKVIMEFLQEQYKGQKLVISAQKYIVNFYQQYQLTPVGSYYLEDGIPHIAMERII